MAFSSSKLVGALCALGFIIGCGALVGCGGEVVELGPPPTRPVKIFTVSGIDGTSLRRFPGSIDASQRADVAFRVSGRLQEMLVKEGDAVERGAVLARLDPTDFNIVVQDRQATFDKDERNFQRANELIADGNISKFDYDRMEANEKTSLAALTQAKQDLEYTEMRAPFTGRIARRSVENFEEVLARQTIFRLQNVAQLDVKIDLPESLIRTFSGSADSQVSSSDRDRYLTAYAQFEGRPDARFDLQIKEVATKADPQTQTFQITFSMPSPRNFTVLPGMTATVSVDFSKLVDEQQVKWVPVTAVQADSGLNPRVWILDDESMTVSSRPVVIGRMSGNQVEVRSGLSGGEEIVSVGAPYLAEGMKVTRMVLSEQAVPRADDPA
ncbi:MAG: efflux RND transporter periplasmic adaptor subunit [Gammaproteobacteria bacterium]|nr:efflux RND transporter periplasmic adaptor subunit [Gammaproteobacteria bacterium]